MPKEESRQLNSKNVPILFSWVGDNTLSEEYLQILQERKFQSVSPGIKIMDFDC